MQLRGAVLLGAGLALLFLGVGQGRAEVFTFDSPREWQAWQIPKGIVELAPEGYLQLVKYRKNVDPVRDAALFTHPTQKRGDVPGGIWNAGSNSQAARRVIDGDLQTFWQPDPADPLPRWRVEIDLGRAVLAREIKLRFPDREGARPFRQFRVLVTTGARVQVSDDVFKYDVVFRTTQPNADTLISIALTGLRDTTYALESALDVGPERESDYRVVQFIRIAVDEQSADAALAEVEVVGMGDNVSLGTLVRGGSFSNGLLGRDPQNLFDGNMDTYGNIFTVFQQGDWKEEGLWWQVDLGALFWIDEIFLYWQDRGEALASFLYDHFHAGTGYAILFSDGRRTTSGEIDFEPLVLQPKSQSEREWSLRHFRYLFKPRKVRYLLWHGLEVKDHAWYSHPVEFMLFSPGYPARVELHSGFIDLGQVVGDQRPKAIKTLSWEAELPPATRLQVRSRAGNTLQEIYTFYDKLGNVISESEWNRKPKVVRGPVDTAVVVGQDWGEWSNFYQFSGEAFKSESPRRYIQLELILSTEDPQAAPLVRSLSIEFEEALVQEARGLLLPRQAPVNQDTRFVYAVWPQPDVRDSGFDRLRVGVPSGVEAGSVGVQVGGAAVTPSEVAVEGDSLLVVDLPARVRADSVALSFSARVRRNATVFELELGYSDRPGLWQSVAPAQRQGNVVFLPDLAGSDRLIGDLEIAPAVFTPNGDGVNDQVQVRFAVFKVAGGEPRVRIYDLAGRLVAQLGEGEGRDVKVFTWSGRDLEGVLVPPGIYTCHIQVGADAGQGEVLHTLAVAY